MGSLADRLREMEKADCMAMRVMKAADPDGRSTCTLYCRRCREAASHILADAIEAEEAKIAVDAMREAVEERTKAEQNGVDVDELLKLADHLAEISGGKLSYDFSDVVYGRIAQWADTIRNAVKGATFEQAKPQLPEGVIWPTFDDGQPVMFGDEFVTVGGKYIVDRIEFNHERVGLPVSAFTVATYRYGEPVKRPEVLDANGVKVNVGDIVWGQDGKQWNVIGFNHKKEHCVIAESGDKTKDLRPEWLTHRMPDTQEAIDDDASLPPREYYARHIGHDVGLKDDAEITWAMIVHLLMRQRELLGGE